MIVARYTAIEATSIDQEDERHRDDLRELIVGLYVAVLKFQATAACHFDNHTLARTVRSPLQLDDWTKLLQKVKFKDTACKDLIAIRDSRNEATALTSLQEALKDQDVKLQSIIASLQLTQKETNQMMRWISDVHFNSDHE